MKINELSEEEIVKIATPIMDNLIQGSTEEDWAKHTQHFSADAKASLTEEELLRQCKIYKSAFGDFDQRKLIGVTQHPKYVNVLWKQSMSKHPGEYLAVLTLTQNDSDIEVARCWVDLWTPKS